MRPRFSGDPDVECLDDRIRFWTVTQKYFAGRIYSKGRAHIPACTFGGFASQRTTKPHYDVMFGQCGMNSLRSVSKLMNLISVSQFLYL